MNHPRKETKAVKKKQTNTQKSQPEIENQRPIKMFRAQVSTCTFFFPCFFFIDIKFCFFLLIAGANKCQNFETRIGAFVRIC